MIRAVIVLALVGCRRPGPGPDTQAVDAHAPDAAVSDSPPDAGPDAGQVGQPEPDKPKPKPPVKLDVANLGTPGEAVALIPVRGKITIFDFWAPWCQPCKTLDPALVELVRRHPGKVALRKIDVVDLDSAAAAKYLVPRGFDLPHVKVFDARGTLILERTPGPGKLPALIDELGKLVH